MAKSPHLLSAPICRTASRGFTLTEMLVVILIIGMLAGMIMGAVGAVRRKAGRDRTRVCLQTLRAAILMYEGDWHDFPPGNGKIEGAESLWQALSSTRFEGPYLRKGDIPVADTNNNGRKEIVDNWDQPLSYIHHRNYLGEPNPDEFRITSPGPDGKAATSDDINNW
jgi:general secretion pathway protein G